MPLVYLEVMLPFLGPEFNTQTYRNKIKMLPCNCSGLFPLGLWVYVPSQQATHKQFIFDRAFKKLGQKDLLHQWRRVRGTCTQSNIKLTVESGNNSTHISRKKNRTIYNSSVFLRGKERHIVTIKIYLVRDPWANSRVKNLRGSDEKVKAFVRSIYYILIASKETI